MLHSLEIYLFVSRWLILTVTRIGDGCNSWPGLPGDVGAIGGRSWSLLFFSSPTAVATSWPNFLKNELGVRPFSKPIFIEPAKPLVELHPMGAHCVHCVQCTPLHSTTTYNNYKATAAPTALNQPTNQLSGAADVIWVYCNIGVWRRQTTNQQLTSGYQLDGGYLQVTTS